MNQSIELHLGDCFSVLKNIPLNSIDAIVTDPPYGLGKKWKGGTRQWGLGQNGKGMQWDDKVSSHVVEIVLQFQVAIVWGGHLYPLPPRRGWLIWDKKQGGSFTSGHAEMAWTTLDQPIRTFRMSQVEAYCNQSDKKRHPAQKPVPLMEWCLSFLPEGCTVLDPYMGSGTTGIACLKTGRRFVGIEEDPDYFAMAKKRFDNANPLLPYSDHE